MKKKLLIVGGGFGQLPAIVSAKEHGREVIVVDRNADAAGMLIADYSYPIDIIDMEGVLNIARKHEIDGIMTMQSDLPVPTVGYVNDHLKLKGVSYEVAMNCSNKIETRERLKSHSCAQPRFEVVDSIESAILATKTIGLPCVVKAPDSSGSRGVVKVNSLEEVDSAFKEAMKYTRGQLLLVEEFIPGLEFGAQSFSVNGRCEIVLLHNDTMSSPPYMIPVGHSFPFQDINEELKHIAEDDIKRAVLALGITDGPANIDLIFDEVKQEVKIIEIGARIGATCLPELVYYYSGIDWVNETINCALNESVNLTPKWEQNVAALIMDSPVDGVFKGVEYPAAIHSENILEYEITAKKGDKVNILRKGTDRIGKIVAKGKTVKEAEEYVTSIKNDTIINVSESKA